MPTYRCRTVAPRQTSWCDVEALSPEDAAQTHHDRRLRSDSIVYVPDEKKAGSRVYFALVEVEGHGEMVSRIFTSEILRRGGVKSNRPPVTLADVAQALGWGRDPQELVASGWDGETEDWA